MRSILLFRRSLEAIEPSRSDRDFSPQTGRKSADVGRDETSDNVAGRRGQTGRLEGSMPIERVVTLAECQRGVSPAQARQKGPLSYEWGVVVSLWDRVCRGKY